ncbi:two-component system chemotaxis sensor kinase CheA [Actinoplanes campanulatus]|uniref:histidine kinase n=1 Tax=Actinoplanes campanulatus TaxID=113559 RepID=A0A7W5AIU0_9ACTN|nr:chemotaxis protein CheA [Actinoplanes campanulatus]MBB3097036.1 two-component system chemotaxis sensor kinase CheA [Actinoplanes campanulatus]GGN15207.1 ATPase [Actinoplanes campanulatus]GID37783.1 ATPase [Actinoplanes campanulatus]
MEDLGEIVGEFLMESHENLDQIDRDLVSLEQEPGSRDLISRIFRAIHTIKGTSGFLAFSRLEKLAHAGESLLSRLRDGVQPVSPETITVLLLCIDGVRSILASIEENGSEAEVDIDSVIVKIQAQMNAPSDGAPAAAPAPAPAAEAEAPVSVEQESAEIARSAPEPVADQRQPLGQILVDAGAAQASDVSSALQQQIEGDERKLGTILLEEGKTQPAAVNEALQSQTPKRSIADSAIRVDVDLLDTLMNMVGELVLARNQLVRGVMETGDSGLVRSAQRLGMITSELQEGIMKTRMQPIEHIWSKLPRVIRDLSNSMGKQVALVMEGKETELDRSLLEAVKDPLTHLVRNAVDHGIEDPERRIASGKGPEGTLTLRAYHEGGHVAVEVADDGAGLDIERIAQKAVQNGLLRPEQIPNMDKRDIMAMVFQPGFSTAAKVTNVSGRGVGMDVVKTNIENIGGAVSVDSTPGEGTVWRLTIPLTLAIIQALTVDCGDQRYVVPQVAVLELVFIDGNTTKVEYASGAPVYRLRGKLLPLVRLDRALGLEVGGDQGVYIMVLQADGRRFGLVVDRVLNTEEVVVKALNTRFKDIGLYAGATILGDGKVGLILDVSSLARRSHLAVDSERESVTEKRGQQAAGTERLLVTAVGERRVAIPLDTVTRLEEFPRDRIEHAGSREVVQYRGQILPLVRLSHLLGAYGEELEGDTVSVVVYSEGGKSVALVVDRIVDIAENSTTARRDAEEDGLVGTAVIQQRVTELLDVRRAILAADPNFYSDSMDEMMVEV